MNETRELLERVGERFDFPDHAFEGLRHRRERKQRNKRIAGGVAGIAVFVVMVLIATTAGRSGPSSTPASPATTTTPAPAVLPWLDRDSMIDLNTGVITPLPKVILRSLGDAEDSQTRRRRTDPGSRSWGSAMTGTRRSSRPASTAPRSAR